MLYVYHGTDGEKSRKGAKALIDTLLKKRPDAVLHRLDAEAVLTVNFGELAGSQGLFSSNFIIYLDNSLLTDEQKDKVVEALPQIKDSTNVFVILENKITKELLGKLEKYATKVTQAEQAEKKLNKQERLAAIGEKLDFGEVTEALGKRDKKTLWALFAYGLEKEVPAEEMHGMFFWQVRTMIVVGQSKSATEADLSPFVYSKNKPLVKNFSLAELKKMSGDLVRMYHEAHRGNVDFYVELEKWILGL